MRVPIALAAPIAMWKVYWNQWSRGMLSAGAGCWQWNVAQTRRLGTSSKAWLQRQRNDPLVKKAKDQDLRARSAFKLQEIQEKHKIIKNSSVVLDLGSAPGGWSTVASKHVQPQAGGFIIAVDLLSMQPVQHTTFLQGDFTTSSIKSTIKQLLFASNTTGVNVILSDMLHNTTGVHDLDHYKSMALVREVINFATSPTEEFPRGPLLPSGTVLCKYLRGEDEQEYIRELKELFVSVQVVKPTSSRSESREAFLLLQKRKVGAAANKDNKPKLN